MRNVALLTLFLLSTVSMATENIYLGSTSTRPTRFELYKNRSGDVELYVEAEVRWGDESNYESFKKEIPELEIRGKRDIYLEDIYVGRVNGVFKGDYINKNIMDIISQKEEYCSRYINGNDCVEIGIRFNIYLLIK